MNLRRGLTTLAALSALALAPSLATGHVSGDAPPSGAPSGDIPRPPQGENLAHKILKVVENGPNRIVTVGGFHPDSRAPDPDPSITTALLRFGPPTTVDIDRDNAACRVDWAQIGVTILFVDVGGSDPCAAGRAQVIEIRGEAARGFHTNRDLYIRSSLDRLKRLYPQRYIGRGEWSLLRQYYSPGGPKAHLLTAQVTDGKVSSFTLYPLDFAAGD
jgi:hypothetical protein